MMRVRCLCLVLFLGSLVSCQSLETGAPIEKPQLSKDMPLDEAFKLSVSYGSESLPELRDLARDRSQLGQLHEIAQKELANRHDDLPTPVLLNVAHIYRISGGSVDVGIVRQLVHSKQESVRRVGWRLAAARPSADLARTIEAILSEALVKGREEDMLLADMAVAVEENRVISAYSYLVLGLMEQGSAEYAKAMLALDPQRASGPFIQYLSRADLEDLRQLSQKSVNLLTCTVVFRFFLENPLPLSNPDVAQIFLYAVSRNRALSEMAFALLEKHIPENRHVLATMLTQQPVPVQVAFIESSQREATSNIRLFLEDVRELAQQKEVIEELNAQQGATEK